VQQTQRLYGDDIVDLVGFDRRGTRDSIGLLLSGDKPMMGLQETPQQLLYGFHPR
jgi:hypothetical protein